LLRTFEVFCTRWIVPKCPGRFMEKDPKILSSYAANSFKAIKRHFINGWIFVPKISTPLTKSSNVSINPLDRLFCRFV